MFASINWLATLVASAAMFVVGWFWYSPAGFGNVWMKEAGLTKKNVAAAKKKGMAPQLITNFLSNVIMVAVLGSVLSYMKPADIPGSMWISAVLAVGLTLTTTVSLVLYENKSWKYFFINAGYTIVTFMLAGAILTAW